MRALGSPLAPEFYESLEELLIAGDVGPTLAARLSAAVRARKPRSLEEVQAALEAEVVAALSPESRDLNLASNPSVILVYGVNGAGKTTTVGKLAHGMKSAGRRPLVVAADTFRVAGIEQMLAWAERAGGTPSPANRAATPPRSPSTASRRQGRAVSTPSWSTPRGVSRPSTTWSRS